MVEETKQITFKTETSGSHITFLSNRVWGGLQEGGLFELNFLLETTRLPDKVTVKVNSTGTLQEVSRSQANEIIRKNQATAYLTLETLLSLQNWLNDKVRELEKQGMIQKVDAPSEIKEND